MTPETIMVFLNERPEHAAVGSTLSQLVAATAPDLAAGLGSGSVVATDGRGVPVTGDTVLRAGMIFRVVRSARSPEDSRADA